MSKTKWQDFEFSGDDVRQDIAQKYGFDGDLLDIFVDNKPLIASKWHHYIPLYERYFGPYRNKPVRFLEIGVFKGGSLAMWRKYFGPEATIFGADIDPSCSELDGVDGQVRIGSQDDPDFLRQVIEEMGGVDIVLDDGSHRMHHLGKTFEIIFPMLADKGIYMVEDLHTAYWTEYGGGLDADTNFFHYLRQRTDDMHHWYHYGETGPDDLKLRISGIHIHDSIAVIEKSTVHQPAFSLRPRQPKA